MIRKPVIVASLVLFTGCSWAYARLSYSFSPLHGNSQILFESGAQDLAKLVADHLAASVDKVEKQHYIPFKDAGAIRVYVFNDRGRYARFSRCPVQSRGCSTTDEVYLSEKLREKSKTLPAILTHELSHVHIRQYTGTFRYTTDLPGWFLEGLAVAVSSGGGAENVTAEQAEAAIRKTIQFEPDDSGRVIGHKGARSYGLEPHMYYRQTSLFVEYLRKTNPDGFESVVKDMLNGLWFRDVWKKHYGQDISVLWRSYEKSLGA